MNMNEYIFKYEYEQRKKQLDTLIFMNNERMTPVKKRFGFSWFKKGRKEKTQSDDVKMDIQNVVDRCALKEKNKNITKSH